MSFADTLSFSEALRDVYERSGYILVHVPGSQSMIERPSFASSFPGASSHAYPGRSPSESADNAPKAKTDRLGTAKG